MTIESTLERIAAALEALAAHTVAGTAPTCKAKKVAKAVKATEPAPEPATPDAEPPVEPAPEPEVTPEPEPEKKAPTVTKEQINSELQEAWARCGNSMDKIQELFVEFGVQSLRDLKEGDYDELYAKAKELK